MAVNVPVCALPATSVVGGWNTTPIVHDVPPAKVVPHVPGVVADLPKLVPFVNVGPTVSEQVAPPPQAELLVNVTSVVALVLPRVTPPKAMLPGLNVGVTTVPLKLTVAVPAESVIVSDPVFVPAVVVPGRNATVTVQICPGALVPLSAAVQVFAVMTKEPEVPVPNAADVVIVMFTVPVLVSVKTCVGPVVVTPRATFGNVYGLGLQAWLAVPPAPASSTAPISNPAPCGRRLPKKSVPGAVTPLADAVPVSMVGELVVSA